MKAAIIGLALAVLGTASQAQDFYHPQSTIDSPVQQRRPASPDDINTCLRINERLGRIVGAMNHETIIHEQSSGGVLSFDEASHIRNLIFLASGNYIDAIHRTAFTGDVAECRRLEAETLQRLQIVAEENPLGSRYVAHSNLGRGN